MSSRSSSSLSLSRRQLLAMLPAGVAAAGLLGLGASAAEARAALPAFPAPVSLDQCAAMTPLAMAESAAVARAARDYCLQACDRITDATLRRLTRELLESPAPTFMRGKGEAEKGAIMARLKAEKLLAADADANLVFPPVPADAGALSFLVAPGSKYNGHHGYPGGLATHVAGNVAITLGMVDAYEQIYGMTPLHDIALAGQLLHDNMKPWVFQWQADGACLPEGTIAGTGAHHVLGVAEAWHRGLPAPALRALASAHAAYSDKEDKPGPAQWIKAAAIMLDRDPVAEQILDAEGAMPQPLSVEQFVVHLGDGDWVFTGHAATGARRALEAVGQARFGFAKEAINTAPYNAFRNYVCAQATMERLYGVFATQGQAGVEALAVSLVAA